jgi:hypothetical protein
LAMLKPFGMTTHLVLENTSRCTLRSKLQWFAQNWGIYKKFPHILIYNYIIYCVIDYKECIIFLLNCPAFSTNFFQYPTNHSHWCTMFFMFSSHLNLPCPRASLSCPKMWNQMVPYVDCDLDFTRFPTSVSWEFSNVRLQNGDRQFHETIGRPLAISLFF